MRFFRSVPCALIIVITACTPSANDPSTTDAGNSEAADRQAVPEDASEDAQAPDAEDATAPDEPADAGEASSFDSGPSADSGHADDAASPDMTADVGVPNTLDGGALAEGGETLDTAVGGSSNADAGSIDATTIRPCSTPNPSGNILLNLGVTQRAYVSGTRAASASSDKWVLWNRGTQTPIARGELYAGTLNPWTGRILQHKVALSASLMLTMSASTTLQVRASSDGALLGQIPLAANSDFKFGIATDSGYVWTADGFGIHLWSPSGQSLANNGGDYTQALVYAAPNEVRVGIGPTANVIEFVKPNGQVTTSPAFTGTFSAWFGDGTRFISGTGTFLQIYSSSADPISLVSLSTSGATLGGFGEYYWTRRLQSVDVYRVGAGTTPILTVPYYTPVVSETDGYLAIVASVSDAAPDSATWVDMHGASLVTRALPLPLEQVPLARAIAGPGGELWAITSQSALYYTSGIPTALHPLTCGPVRAVSTSQGLWSVSVGAHQILVIDLQRRALRTVFASPADELETSTDGKIASYAELSGGSTGTFDYVQQTRLFDATSQRVLAERVSQTENLKPRLHAVALSSDGTDFALGACNLEASGPYESDCYVDVTDASGAPSIHIDTSPVNPNILRLSPSGERLAVSTPEPGNDHRNATTAIYSNGVLTGVTRGYPFAWLTPDTLLVRVYTTLLPSSFAGMIVVNATGVQQSVTQFPEMIRGTLIGNGSRAYSAEKNAIYDGASGMAVWSKPQTSQGVVVGSADEHFVVYTIGNDADLIVESY
jgi:hypothetical protein